MALRGAVCRLLVNSQRPVIISACRAQGTATHARWGKCNDTIPATVVILIEGPVKHAPGFQCHLQGVRPFTKRPMVALYLELYLNTVQTVI